MKRSFFQFYVLSHRSSRRDSAENEEFFPLAMNKHYWKFSFRYVSWHPNSPIPNISSMILTLLLTTVMKNFRFGLYKFDSVSLVPAPSEPQFRATNGYASNCSQIVLTSISFLFSSSQHFSFMSNALRHLQILSNYKNAIPGFLH